MTTPFYVSVDVVASGSTPGMYTLLSLGACAVDTPDQTFYKELQPINFTFNLEAMRAASKGLRCLDRRRSHPLYNPDVASFNPLKVLLLLQKQGAPFSLAFSELGKWVQKCGKGRRPVLVATPLVFDGMWVHWYFDNYAPTDNPFDHRGIDIASVYKGLEQNMEADVGVLGFHKENTYNALESAVQQAQEFTEILKRTRQRP